MNDSQTPKARKSGLVIQEAGDEVLVYDTATNQAHCLNGTAAFVWQSCDGRNTVGGITEMLNRKFDGKVGEDFVWLALDQLSRENLLEERLEPKAAAVSRRDALRRIGYAAAIALPAVAMLSFPNNALAVTCAASYCGSNSPANGCNPGDFCCRNAGGQYICQAVCTNPC